jgi:dUTP pyrophosphatase
VSEPPQVPVLFRRLHPAAQLPRYAHAGDAGADLCCCEAFTMEPGERRLVGTGLAIALPEGYAAFVHPRSGLAARFGVTVLNAPGTVDAGYRGEIQVCLLNTDRSGLVGFAAGDRIAQLVVQQVAWARFTAVDALPESDRGIGGHGSTGGILGR